MTRLSDANFVRNHVSQLGQLIVDCGSGHEPQFSSLKGLRYFVVSHCVRDDVSSDDTCSLAYYGVTDTPRVPVYTSLMSQNIDYNYIPYRQSYMSESDTSSIHIAIASALTHEEYVHCTPARVPVTQRLHHLLLHQQNSETRINLRK